MPSTGLGFGCIHSMRLKIGGREVITIQCENAVIDMYIMYNRNIEKRMEVRESFKWRLYFCWILEE